MQSAVHTFIYVIIRVCVPAALLPLNRFDIRTYRAKKKSKIDSFIIFAYDHHHHPRPHIFNLIYFANNKKMYTETAKKKEIRKQI